MSQAPKQPLSLILVTRDIALKFLESNIGNRPLRSTKIALYERILRGGQWETTTDAVGFSTAGRLINGQHRLRAIANTGVAAELAVQYGLKESAQMVLDRGSRRTATDALILSRGKFAPVAARVARSFMALLGQNKNTMTDAQVVQHVQEHAATYEWLAGTRLAKDKVSAPVMAALAYAYEVRPAQAATFARKMGEPVDLPELSPVLHAIQIAREPASSGAERSRMVLRILRCLQAFCEGQLLAQRSVYAKEVGLKYFQDLHNELAVTKAVM